MNRFQSSFLTLLVAVCVVLFGGGFAVAQDAPYVGAYEADNFFSTITSNEMSVLRTKKILFLSRSFGLNMRDGLTDLKNQNPMYDILNSYVNYDLLNNGLSIVETNAFSKYNFVHCMATYWPHTTRLTELNTLMRDPPYAFGSQVDVVMVYWHYALESVFDTYTNTFDSLQADFPNAKFVYVTAGFMDTNHVAENTASAAFSAKVRARYQGHAPLYDLGHILNNDTDLLGYLPEYSSDPAGVHPNAPFAEQRMGKAFLLMLRDLYFGSGCTNMAPPTVPGNLTATALSDSAIQLSWAPSVHECGISRYDLMRNGTVIASPRATNYTDTGLAENTAYQYTVRAVSMMDAASSYSSTTTVATLADSVAPSVVKVTALSSSQLAVEFSENMDSVSAQTAANYSINQGITVFSASLSGKTVTLSTSSMTDGTSCTLSISNVKDASSAKNPVAPGTQITFTYRASAYPEDPVGYWSFNGTTNDSSGNGLNAVWVGTPSYTTALLGQGLALDGSASGSYSKVNYNSLLDGMAQLSVSIWARKNDPSVGGDLFRKHITYNLAVNVNGLKGYVYTTVGAANISVTTVPGINDTNWHHYCLVYNGTNVLTYVDGIQRSSQAKSGNVTNAPAYFLSIAKDANHSPGYSFAGDVDELKLFRRALSTNEISGLVAAGVGGAADRVAVRSLLDTNGLTNKQVDAISVYKNDRVDRLYLQESGVSNITSAVGQLSELTLLHCYGDRALGYPLLTQVAPEIGNCAKLTELLLSQNNLASLPAAVTNLTRLTICSIGDNYLCDANPVWESWANTYDPDWWSTQNCGGNFVPVQPVLDPGFGRGLDVITWTPGSGRTYNVYYSTNLTAGFHVLGSNLDHTVQRLTNTVQAPSVFYKVEEQ